MYHYTVSPVFSQEFEKKNPPKLLFTGRHFWNRKCRKKTWWQQEFAVLKCEATANSVTGHVCMNSNTPKKRHPCRSRNAAFISFTILSIAYAIQFLFIHAIVRSLFCDVDIMRMALF